MVQPSIFMCDSRTDCLDQCVISLLYLYPISTLCKSRQYHFLIQDICKHQLWRVEIVPDIDVLFLTDLNFRIKRFDYCTAGDLDFRSYAHRRNEINDPTLDSFLHLYSRRRSAVCEYLKTFSAIELVIFKTNMSLVNQLSGQP